ncbi:hypothetical protein A8950_2878 [Dongia mobilis]|uniref:Fervidolysin-like N-terminal prodomain domain-containing protein n=1 Tax=Dongia mobilis TaxID=578943 RepID=A0A4R6WQT4_9PROT|nr:hypothetical protein [Dongia mobilis]TDQ81008.1 hypothetical protein A8950_2878 [Dongia mobilis]
MNAEQGQDQNRISLDEAQEILPWYLTGRASRAEAAAIEGLLKESAELRNQLDAAKQQRQAVIDGGAATGEPSDATLTRLLQQIETTRQRRFAAVEEPGFFARLFGPRPLMKFALACACLLVVAQGALLYRSGALPFVSTPEGEPAGQATYATAAATGEVPEMAEALGAELLVAFRPEVTAAQITQILTELDASVIDGPKPGLTFVLRLATGVDVNEAIARLQSRPDLIATAQRR